jgi:REP element-mobilizing transposase RayT
MPNHIHGIIVLGTGGAKCPRPPTPSQPNRIDEVPPPSLGQIVAYFKYQSTKYINQHRDTPGTRIWQRNYYDHVIRDDIDLQRVRQYITHNPAQWELDQLYPDNLFN